MVVLKPFDYGNVLQTAANIDQTRARTNALQAQTDELESTRDNRRTMNEIALMNARGPIIANAARAIITSEDPVRLTQQVVPSLVEKGILPPDMIQSISGPLQSEQVVGFAQGLLDRYTFLNSQQAEYKPITVRNPDGSETTKFYNPANPNELLDPGLVSAANPSYQVRAGQDAQGNPAFVRIDPQAGTSELIGGAGRPVPNRGLQAEIGADGTVRIGQYGLPLAPTRTTTNDLQSKIVAAQATLDNLQAINQNFDRRYLTMGGQLTAGWQGIKDKAGIELNANEAEFLEGFTSFKVAALDGLNRYIQQITGAAMSTTEAQRIEAAFPNMGMGPAEFQAALKTVTERLMRVQWRANYTLRMGISDYESIPINSIDSIMDERGAQLEDELRGTVPDDQLEALVLSRIRQEFMQGG